MGGPWYEIRRLRRCGGHQDPAAGNQRDFDDVDWWEGYLLLLVTHPRYQQKIPGVDASRRREFAFSR